MHQVWSQWFFLKVELIMKMITQTLSTDTLSLLQYGYICTLGWVNLYHKFKIEKYTISGKLIFPKNIERHFKFFFAQLVCEFACICEYLQASFDCISLKDMQSKI